MSKSNNMSGRAALSQCGSYRYVLDRTWAGPLIHPRLIYFILLNPSTADAMEDDPTIRRCIAFARREHCTSLRILNLFALRSTDPVVLLSHHDPVGPENDAYFQRHLSTLKDAIWVVGWGVTAHKLVRDRAHALLDALKIKKAWCLGINSDGSPKHPLYLPSDAKLVPYNFSESHA